MKVNKILPILLVLMIPSLFSFAQDITTDTTLANSYFEKAEVFKDSTQYDSAIVYFEKASLLYEKTELWRKYLQSETKHGECYQKQWQLNQAIATIKPAIEKTLQHINENDTIVANAYDIIGLQYYYQSNYDSTLFCWEKTLFIRNKILGEQHKDIAESYNRIGYIYIDGQI